MFFLAFNLIGSFITISLFYCLTIALYSNTNLFQKSYWSQYKFGYQMLAVHSSLVTLLYIPLNYTVFNFIHIKLLSLLLWIDMFLLFYIIRRSGRSDCDILSEPYLRLPKPYRLIVLFFHIEFLYYISSIGNGNIFSAKQSEVIAYRLISFLVVCVLLTTYWIQTRSRARSALLDIKYSRSMFKIDASS